MFLPLELWYFFLGICCLLPVGQLQFRPPQSPYCFVKQSVTRTNLRCSAASLDLWSARRKVAAVRRLHKSDDSLTPNTAGCLYPQQHPALPCWLGQQQRPNTFPNPRRACRQPPPHASSRQVRCAQTAQGMLWVLLLIASGLAALLGRLQSLLRHNMHKRFWRELSWRRCGARSTLSLCSAVPCLCLQLVWQVSVIALSGKLSSSRTRLPGRSKRGGGTHGLGHGLDDGGEGSGCRRSLPRPLFWLIFSASLLQPVHADTPKTVHGLQDNDLRVQYAHAQGTPEGGDPGKDTDIKSLRRPRGDVHTRGAGASVPTGPGAGAGGRSALLSRAMHQFEQISADMGWEHVQTHQQMTGVSGWEDHTRVRDEGWSKRVRDGIADPTTTTVSIPDPSSSSLPAKDQKAAVQAKQPQSKRRPKGAAAGVPRPVSGSTNKQQPKPPKKKTLQRKWSTQPKHTKPGASSATRQQPPIRLAVSSYDIRAHLDRFTACLVVDASGLVLYDTNPDNDLEETEDCLADDPDALFLYDQLVFAEMDLQHLGVADPYVMRRHLSMIIDCLGAANESLDEQVAAIMARGGATGGGGSRPPPLDPEDNFDLFLDCLGSSPAAEDLYDQLVEEKEQRERLQRRDGSDIWDITARVAEELSSLAAEVAATERASGASGAAREKVRHAPATNLRDEIPDTGRIMPFATSPQTLPELEGESAGNNVTPFIPLVAILLWGVYSLGWPRGDEHRKAFLGRHVDERRAVEARLREASERQQKEKSKRERKREAREAREARSKKQNSLHSRSKSPDSKSKKDKEKERKEKRDRRDRERKESERRQLERKEKERQEKERQEKERQEKERQEKERQERKEKERKEKQREKEHKQRENQRTAKQRQESRRKEHQRSEVEQRATERRVAEAARAINGVTTKQPENRARDIVAQGQQANEKVDERQGGCRGQPTRHKSTPQAAKKRPQTDQLERQKEVMQKSTDSSVADMQIPFTPLRPVPTSIVTDLPDTRARAPAQAPRRKIADAWSMPASSRAPLSGFAPIGLTSHHPARAPTPPQTQDWPHQWGIGSSNNPSPSDAPYTPGSRSSLSSISSLGARTPQGSTPPLRPVSNFFGHHLGPIIQHSPAPEVDVARPAPIARDYRAGVAGVVGARSAPGPLPQHPQPSLAPRLLRPPSTSSTSSIASLSSLTNSSSTDGTTTQSAPRLGSDLCALLHKLGLDKYIDVFARQEILDLPTLMLLDDDLQHLKSQLGLTLGAQLKLRQAMRELRCVEL